MLDGRGVAASAADTRMRRSIAGARRESIDRGARPRVRLQAVRSTRAPRSPETGAGVDGLRRLLGSRRTASRPSSSSWSRALRVASTPASTCLAAAAAGASAGSLELVTDASW